jgi:acetylornithine deacetylase/succinyl-diaminopimelate desuccinylase-like protein
MSDSEVVSSLRDLIRIDTSNPPGREKAAVDYLAARLRKENIEPVVVESGPGRANLVSRLKSGSSLPPLMLSAHLDVVPPDGTWTYPPFGAEIHDGYIWGRGAVDMKHMAAMSLVVFLDLARLKPKLSRDVVFCAVADEEVGGKFGAGYLVDHHRDLIRAGFCLTEIGGMTIPFGKKVIVPVQTAEKGHVWLKLRARGKPGHGSQAVTDTAIEKLSQATLKLSRTPLKYGLTKTTRNFFSALASAQGPLQAAVLRSLLWGPGPASFALKRLPEERRRVFHALLHDTACVTGLSAGLKANVIPETAEATVDGRFLPGRSQAEFLEEIRAVVGPEIEIEPFASSDPLETEPQSELWNSINAVIKRAIPNSEVVPYQIPGMTDAKDYARAGIKTYGFAPVALKPDEPFASLYHAPDERISIAGLETGLEWLRALVLDFCVEK